VCPHYEDGLRYVGADIIALCERGREGAISPNKASLETSAGELGDERNL